MRLSLRLVRILSELQICGSVRRVFDRLWGTIAPWVSKIVGGGELSDRPTFWVEVEEVAMAPSANYMTPRRRIGNLI